LEKPHICGAAEQQHRTIAMFSTSALKQFATNLTTPIAAVLVACALLAGCAAAGSDTGAAQRSSGKVLACKRGDTMVDSSQQCLQDDAACYQVSNGKWCTGERGNTCPAGSVEIPKGSVCPRGPRCIDYGESLSCAILTIDTISRHK